MKIESTMQSFFELFVLSEPISIAIPLRFSDFQPNAYGVEKASAESYRIGQIIGDTRLGGSCNFSQIKLIPHCNGTHTECVGHITHERISVLECLKDVFMTAVLISVLPEKASETDETYPVKLEPSDLMLTRKRIELALRNHELVETQLPTALIIRTLPNSDEKLTKIYIEPMPPFFSSEAMHFINEKGFSHLLTDLPSIDRLFDEGKLSNHRIFWQLPHEGHELSKEARINKTITELIYVPNEVEDGVYLLNLQIAPFDLEAVPSRPVLFRKQF